jgi:hypothetical protein
VSRLTSRWFRLATAKRRCSRHSVGVGLLRSDAMKFDPQSAEPIFARKDSDELIQIAFLEETYVEEARELARQELAKRGQLDISSETIERVRTDVEAQKAAAEEHNLRSLEIEEEIPAWRRVVRASIAPYRQTISFAAVALMAVFWLNPIFHWGLLKLDGRQSRSLALLIGLIWLVFVAPTRREFRNIRRSNDAGNR